MYTQANSDAYYLR